ncbi:hypothetical protein niasHT_003404 [Heterodera trifolii]|uniref:Uncharacterized protein n=1 Tax=Heterodera trifolii TaxID=157864 RepID=A0ABD2LNP8_9BILA
MLYELKLLAFLLFLLLSPRKSDQTLPKSKTESHQNLFKTENQLLTSASKLYKKIKDDNIEMNSLSTDHLDNKLKSFDDKTDSIYQWLDNAIGVMCSYKIEFQMDENVQQMHTNLCDQKSIEKAAENLQKTTGKSEYVIDLSIFKTFEQKNQNFALFIKKENIKNLRKFVAYFGATIKKFYAEAKIVPTIVQNVHQPRRLKRNDSEEEEIQLLVDANFSKIVIHLGAAMDLRLCPDPPPNLLDRNRGRAVRIVGVFFLAIFVVIFGILLMRFSGLNVHSMGCLIVCATIFMISVLYMICAACVMFLAPPDYDIRIELGKV